MDRTTIDLPEVLRPTVFNWDIDWRGQPPSDNTSGFSQVVYNQFPRWIGTPSFFVTPEELGTWRGIRARVNGRKNVLRVRMDDVVSSYSSNDYPTTPDPEDMQLTTYAESTAGSSVVYVTVPDGYPTPSLGQIMSYNDYPFVVTDVEISSGELVWTSGGTELVWTAGGEDFELVWEELDGDTNLELSVEMPLRTTIPTASDVDWVGRGLFEFLSDTTGNLTYSNVGFSNPSFELREYLR